MLRKFALFASAALGVATAPAYAAYLPTGVQNNVATSTVTGGGWSQCYSEAYGASGTSLSSILSGCSGSNLMLAARETGSDNLILLAQAGFGDVTFNTGDFTNTTHSANGVEWYYSKSFSWGFAPGGATVFRSSCDINDSTSFGLGDGSTINQRLCWHTGSGTMNGGWRVGAVDFLNFEPTGYEKVIYAYNATPGAVPEPASWAMMIGGFGMVGGALRRSRQSVRARIA